MCKQVHFKNSARKDLERIDFNTSLHCSFFFFETDMVLNNAFGVSLMYE